MDGLDVVDRAVINGLQGGFPLDPRPFRTAGEALGLSEHELIARLRRLLEQGESFIRLSPTATSGSVRPLFINVHVRENLRFPRSLRRGSNYLTTTRPAPPTWARLGWSNSLVFFHCHAAGRGRSPSRIVLASCAPAIFTVTPR